MGLQVKGAGIWRAGQKIHCPRTFGIAHVDDSYAVAKAMADVGIAAMDHDLHAVAAAALVAVTDEFDVTGADGCHDEVLRSRLKRCSKSGRARRSSTRNSALCRQDVDGA